MIDLFPRWEKSGMSHEMQELADGVAFWHGRKWPADFHNSEYVKWAKQNPNGDFTLNWWHQFLPILRVWKATRPFSSAELAPRFTKSAAALSSAWQVVCVREHVRPGVGRSA